MRPSVQYKLVSNKRFCITLRRPAFHTPQSRQAEEGFGIEPLLGTLAAKVRHKQIYFSLNCRCRNRHIKIRSCHIAIPFGYLVLKNEMISKCIPREASDLSMVLMCIVFPVS